MKTKEIFPIENQLKVVRIIFFAILTSMLVFFAIVIIIIKNNKFSKNIELEKIFIYFIPVFGLVAMFLSRAIYKQMVTKVNGKFGLVQKIALYRTSKIISWAIVEGACLFSLLAAMLTSEYIYLMVFVFLFGYMFLIKPSKESFVRDMRLNSEETDLILKR
jgi:hypothetical protein